MVRITQSKDWPREQPDEESPGPSARQSDAQQQETRRTSTGRMVGSILFSLISLGLLAIFVLAIVYEGTDQFFSRNWPSSPRILWIIFEGLNVAVPAMFLAYFWICFPTGIFQIITMFVNLWAIVYLLIIWFETDPNLKSASPQALLYLSMSSTVYHSLLSRYWVQKSNNTTQ